MSKYPFLLEKSNKISLKVVKSGVCITNQYNFEGFLENVFVTAVRVERLYAVWSKNMWMIYTK